MASTSQLQAENKDDDNNKSEMLRASLNPAIIYGTAWKKDRTTDLVVKAIRSGFRAIDTACQKKHYEEALVGKALAIVKEKDGIQREALFLQTKFTSVDGQDPSSIPYDPRASLDQQVLQSFATSQKNLGTSYVDSLVMHSPMRTHADTMKVWRTFEALHQQGLVRQLGISNIYSLAAFKRIFEEATVKPAVVQNRFYEQTGWDVDLRAFCRQNKIAYQSFWTLTANPDLLAGPCASVAKELSATPEQVLFRFLSLRGVTPLTGTSSEQHMDEDLRAVALAGMTSKHVALIGRAISEKIDSA